MKRRYEPLPFLSDREKPGFGAVAGILDCFGGLRYVIAPEWQIHCKHVNPDRDERAFVVPGFFMYDKQPNEPWPRGMWEYIPTMTARVDAYIRWWIDTRNDPDELNDYRFFLYLRRHVDGTPQSSLDIDPCLLSS